MEKAALADPPPPYNYKAPPQEGVPQPMQPAYGAGGGITSCFALVLEIPLLKHHFFSPRNQVQTCLYVIDQWEKIQYVLWSTWTDLENIRFREERLFIKAWINDLLELFLAGRYLWYQVNELFLSHKLQFLGFSLCEARLLFHDRISILTSFFGTHGNRICVRRQGHSLPSFETTTPWQFLHEQLIWECNAVNTAMGKKLTLQKC